MDSFMTAFDRVTGAMIGVLWHDAICWILLGVGLLFTILTRGAQFRLIPQMFHLLFNSSGKDSKHGISNFEALMMTVGGRVGIGNIVGVAVAIAAGGPGAVFWMWMTAILGAASAFIESTLAQIYKSRTPEGEFIGGQSYYAEKGLGLKWYGTLVAVILLFANVFGNPCVQSNTIAGAVSACLHIPNYVVGLVVCATLAFIIFGGVKRIASYASKLVPLMCIVYLGIGLILVAVNISKLPGVFTLIFSSAFSSKSALAGLMGSAVTWGVRRGVYSNEAGQGSGSAAAAAADADHPCEQGLMQALSVYLDTLLVCSITAFCVLTTGCYNVVGPDGTVFIENLPGAQAGAPYVQSAISTVIPGGQYIVAFLITLFAFTSLMAYYYQAETAFAYLSQKLSNRTRKSVTNVMRVCFLTLTFLASSWPVQRVWNVTDIGGGILTWAHLMLIVIICGPAVKALKDYDRQRKNGIETPVFDPVALGIKNADLWTTINEEKAAEKAAK